MAKWSAFPHAGDYTFDAGSVRRQWARLHAGDAEPCPTDAGFPSVGSLVPQRVFRRSRSYLTINYA